MVEYPPLYLGLSSGDHFGWGICSRYLKKEISRLVPTVLLEEHPELGGCQNLSGKMLHALDNHDFSSLFKARARENFGYTFFEYELPPLAIHNSSHYDKIFCGSTWCQDKLARHGISNSAVLIQGVDPLLFHPVETKKNHDLFILFSGGKMELRKGQDLVLSAFKIFNEKHPDVLMVTLWYNFWPEVLKTMSMSKHIRFELKGESWEDQMAHLCQINQINPQRIVSYSIYPHDHLKDLIAQTDLGVFPNRCEGGTNLVLMEYMACGKPAIASYNSGHRDVLTSENALLLNQSTPYRIVDEEGRLLADWEEPALEELISQLEYAYCHREQIRQLGNQAAIDMKRFSWKNCAHTALELMEVLI